MWAMRRIRLIYMRIGGGVMREATITREVGERFIPEINQDKVVWVAPFHTRGRLQLVLSNGRFKISFEGLNPERAEKERRDDTFSLHSREIRFLYRITKTMTVTALFFLFFLFPCHELGIQFLNTTLHIRKKRNVMMNGFLGACTGFGGMALLWEGHSFRLAYTEGMSTFFVVFYLRIRNKSRSFKGRCKICC